MFDRLPTRSRVLPVTRCHAASGPRIEKTGSSSERSTTCPRQAPRSRERTAMSVAIAPYSPVTMSAMWMGGSTGSRSANPLR